MSNNYDAGNHYLEVNGIQLHYALSGNASRPTLALVNMASHNLTCWEPVLGDLEQQFHVLRFDIRGTGKSGWDADTNFTFSQYAADLAALMDGLEIKQAIVVGVAYGARAAARFALNHSDKLSALGLFDVALTPPVEQTGQRALGEQARKMLAEAGERPVPLQKYWRFYEDRDAALLAHTAHEHEPDTTNLLGELSAPVLVACGRQDMNLAQAQRIAAAIPHSKFEIMEMTGHASPFYRPALFVELVSQLAAET